MTDRPQNASSNPARWWLGALLAVTLIVHGRNVMNEFVDWDDTVLVVQNPVFNPVTPQHLLQVWIKPVEALYTPMAYTLWAAVTSVSRLQTPDANGISLNPMIFHALNLLLHLACVAIVFDLLQRLLLFASSSNPKALAAGVGETRAIFLPATIGAAIFALHPLQVEPIAWISGMNNLLAGVFSLACIAAYVRSVTTSRRRLWFGLMVLCFVLALFSKPTAIVTPLMIVPIGWLMLREPWKKIAMSLLPLVVLAVPFVIVAKMAQPASGIFAPPILQRPVVAGDAVGFYLCKLVWPAPLYIDYGLRPAVVLANGGGSGAHWFALTVVLVAALITCKRWPWGLAALGVFVAGLALTLGLVPFDFQDYSTVADRYVYLSMLGVAMAAAFAFARTRRPWVYAIAVVPLAAFAFLSFQQNATWADTITLGHYTKSHNPTSLAADTMLGYLAERHGDHATAEQFYRHGLATFPNDTSLNRDLGGVILHDRPAEAIPYLQKAFLRGEHDPRMVNNLGTALLNTGHVRESIDAFNFVLKTDPNHLNAHINLGIAYMRLGELDESEQHLRKALEINPQSASAARWLADLNAMRASQKK